MKTKPSFRVILAEDEYMELPAIRHSVEEIGHEIVAEVSTGEAAIEQTCRLKPDVVLMDIMMGPGMDGLVASEHIQSRCPTPVVVLTAYPDQERVETASEKGVGAYLTKPPNTVEIERAITIAIARHKDLMAYRKLFELVQQRNYELKKALDEIKVLRGLLPICSNCKKIRDTADNWNEIEDYIRERSEAKFSHSICPDCEKELYPELSAYDDAPTG